MRTKQDGTRRKLKGKFHETTFSRFDTYGQPLRRVRSEHPEDEKDDVIRNGRVLGGLEPTRAFGDARYKWPVELQDMWAIHLFCITKYSLADTCHAVQTLSGIHGRRNATMARSSQNPSLRNRETRSDT